jgi:hypothetical protein
MHIYIEASKPVGAGCSSYSSFMNNTLDILDIGCGTGLAGAWLKDYAKTLVGKSLSFSLALSLWLSFSLSLSLSLSLALFLSFSLCLSLCQTLTLTLSRCRFIRKNGGKSPKENVISRVARTALE